MNSEPNQQKPTHPENAAISAPNRQAQRLHRLALAVAISISAVLPGCVYHRRGSNNPYPFQYDHRDAEVVYPWRVTEPFAQEYEFKILATIVLNLIAFPYEFFKGWEKMDLARVLGSPLPGLYHGYENDRERQNRLADRAREHREEQERMRRAEQARSSEDR